MDKQAQTMAALTAAGNTLTKSAQGVTDQLSQLWSTLGDSQKQVIINGLLGGAVGGGAGGIGGALSENSTAAGSGLMGALLGALAGAGGTAGYNLLSGKQLMPGEQAAELPATDKAMNALTGAALSNPATTLGTALGAGVAAKGYPTRSSLRSKIMEVAQKAKGNAGAELGAMSGMGGDASFQEAMRKVLGETHFRPGYDFRTGANAAELTGGGKARQTVEGVRRAITGAGRSGSTLRQAANIASVPRSRLSLAAIPAGAGLGYLMDRYLKGESG